MPNVVLISADDLGSTEITADTMPNLYRLAKEGRSFTRFYAYPVCSPSRAALMTGRNPLEFGYTSITVDHGRELDRPLAKLRPPRPAMKLPEGIPTLGELMRRKGYRTGYFGKWHLGKVEGGLRHLGYDASITTEGYSHILNHVKTTPSVNAPETIRRDHFINDKALAFMDGDGPFYLEIHNFLPHLPLEVRHDLASQNAKPRELHRAHLRELDELIGTVMARVENTDTLILFLSDNGTLESWKGMQVASNRPLRGEKGTVFEGGIRIPFVAWWPGRIDPASDDQLAFLSDVYLMLASLDDEGLERPLRKEVVVHFPHYHAGRPASAMITDRWKIVRDYQTGTDTMYDLVSDPGESTPTPAHLQMSARLTAALGNASLPIANPDYDAPLENCEGDCEQRQDTRRNLRLLLILALLTATAFYLRRRRAADTVRIEHSDKQSPFLFPHVTPCDR